MKTEEQRYQENLIFNVEAYYQLTPEYQQKGINKFHHDFNKQISNNQTTSHADYFNMTLSEHINGIAHNIMFN